MEEGEKSLSWWNLRLTDALGLGLVDVDMLAETSVTITQAFITSVNIIGSGLPDGGCPDAVDPEEASLPVRFSLEQNYPNPFNPSTTIRFALASTSFTELAVYDVLGRRISVLASGSSLPGSMR